MTAQQRITQRILHVLWRNWSIAACSLSAVLFFSILVSPVWLPLIVVLEAYVLLMYERVQHFSDKGNCTIIVHAAILTLFWSAIIMVIINLLNSEWLFDKAINMSAYNRDIPYIPCLVIFPVSAIILSWMLLRGNNLRYCRSCRSRNGFFPGEGFIATLFDRESRYQLTLALLLSASMSGIQWWYYFYYYINVNLNTPDRFFFNFMPIALYMLSLFFVGVRYMNLFVLLGTVNEVEPASTPRSVLRFIILSGDDMLLWEGKDGRWDTPVTLEIPYTTILTEAQARDEFEFGSGIRQFGIKPIYENNGYNEGMNFYHYAIFLDDETRRRNTLGGRWLNLDEISRKMHSSQLSVDMMSELHRIYTITMAWKTYDREGRRLYPIKHYHPTFRLRDLKDWTVDYNDLSWLQVATDNQDRKFWNMRKLWRRLTRSV